MCERLEVLRKIEVRNRQLMSGRALQKILPMCRDTRIYIASGEIYGGEKTLAALKTEFPNIVRKYMLLSDDELRLLKKHSTQMAALDYFVDVATDVFIPSNDGNMAKVVEGLRRYVHNDIFFSFLVGCDHEHISKDQKPDYQNGPGRSTPVPSPHLEDKAHAYSSLAHNSKTEEPNIGLEASAEAQIGD